MGVVCIERCRAGVFQAVEFSRVCRRVSWARTLWTLRVSNGNVDRRRLSNQSSAATLRSSKAASRVNSAVSSRLACVLRDFAPRFR
ncbi:hypothetical protein AGOR_G00206220 [Albula goreensis]|uniref:Uncharacterized protein n=1 Tax=Albula goreensis TaxID=1534307 RepID=A0A8T3CNV7_9TELE|nr:hypothetical protein AGOR_G00206220 [Albula goreensis]